MASSTTELFLFAVFTLAIPPLWILKPELVSIRSRLNSKKSFVLILQIKGRTKLLYDNSCHTYFILFFLVGMCYMLNLIGSSGIETTKLNLICSNKNVTNNESKWFKMSKCHVTCSWCISNTLFLPKCLPSFDFKRSNFAQKLQEYPFADRYYAMSVSALPSR